MMLSTQLSSLVTLLAFTILFRPYLSQAQTCRRQSSKKDETPDFFCQFNVTLQRQSDCSAFITERFILPHTTGNDFRFVPALDDLQGVSNVSIFRDGEEITISSSESDSNRDNLVRISFETQPTPNPVLFEVRYTLSNAVLRFTEACELDEEADPDKNVMRWRLENVLDQKFDEVFVTFATENEDASLSVLGDERAEDGSDAQRQILRKTNVDETVEIYVAEEGVSLCLQDQQCFPSGPNVGVIVGLSVAGGAVLVVLVACLVGCCCTRRLKKQHEAAEQEGRV